MEFNRCQHKQVNWIGKDTGRCESCGKVGHWFEDAKLVIWHRQDPEPAAVQPVFEFDGSQLLAGPAIPPNVSLPTTFAVKTG